MHELEACLGLSDSLKWKDAYELNLIFQPAQALLTKLPLKGFSTKLGSQQRNVLYDGQPNPPMSVICQILDCRHQTLSKQIDAYHLVDLHNPSPCCHGP